MHVKQKQPPALLAAISLFFTFASCQLMAQEKPLAPWFGHWKMGNSTLIMEPWEDGIKFRITGNGVNMAAFARMDGKIYPETGNPRSDGLIFNPIDDRSYEFVGTKNGEVVVRTTISFPPDGVTRISHTTFLFGEEVDNVSVTKRVIAEAEDPWFGVWKLGETTLIMEPWEDGFFIKVSAPAQGNGAPLRGNGFARFDGKLYPVSGYDNVDAIALERIDDKSYKLTQSLNGEVTSLTVVSFSADGNTRKSESRKPGSDAAPQITTWTRA